ncbi:MAG: ATP-binding protein [Candidatus Sumerlaeaceae bacterium]|nr:ATP-binding protein [Candidatus Sumerlaeaceae bacterium]
MSAAFHSRLRRVGSDGEPGPIPGAAETVSPPRADSGRASVTAPVISVVLAVRDEKLADVLDDYLTSCGLRVALAETPHQVPALARQAPYQCAVLDTDFPECRSGEILARLAEAPAANPAMRVVLIGSLEPPPDSFPADAAVHGCLLKPFHPEWLVRAIRQAAAGDAHLAEITALRERVAGLEHEAAVLRERAASLQERSHWAELAGSLTHEIKNLLSVIKVSTQYLLKRAEETGLDSRMTKHLGMISQQVDRSQEQIVRFGGMAQGRATTVGPCEVSRTVSELIALLEYTLTTRNIRVKSDLAPHLPAAGMDEGVLRTILINLLLNARDAMPDGGRILICAHAAANGGIEVDVEDTGCGIASGDLERIFEPFYSTKQGPQASGLGLSLSRQMARASGGDLEAVPNHSPGALFRLILPAADPGDRGPRLLAHPPGPDEVFRSTA